MCKTCKNYTPTAYEFFYIVLRSALGICENVINFTCAGRKSICLIKKAVFNLAGTD